LFIGPVFTREVVTAPRRIRFYVTRTIYPTALLLLICTAWLLMAGTQPVSSLGELARFGQRLFQILAPLQLALVTFLSALFSASAVAQEKDRRTLVLLLLSRLRSSELVLGKLAASLLTLFVPLAAAGPLFMLCLLLGGISVSQIGRVFVISLATTIAAGSLGSTIALWREKTFQALALTTLVLVFWLGLWEIVQLGVFGTSLAGWDAGHWATTFSPWRAILNAARPTMAEAGDGLLDDRLVPFLIASLSGTLLLNLIAIGRVRAWNTTAAVRRRGDQEGESPRDRESLFSDAAIANTPGDSTAAATTAAATTAAVPATAGPAGDSTATDVSATIDTEAAVTPAASTPVRFNHQPAQFRTVWDNPILWREIRTWAYGRRILAIRVSYWVLFALLAGVIYQSLHDPRPDATSQVPGALAALCVLSLVLVNAQAVTSITTERDGRALDLLLASDLTPKEFVFGKLGGVFYNMKEMVLLPILFCVYLWIAGVLRLEHVIYLSLTLGVLNLFVAMLGIHVGMAYTNSRSAIGVSLGTVFFLFLGVATCVWMIISFSGSFEMQLQPFLAFMGGGGVGLYVALGWRNPSRAIFAASMLCPIATLYAITSYQLDSLLAACLVTCGTYGFASAAMMIPAIFEFDVATGRTTPGQ
jgi:ABC-type transport system involved in multi-copper enzyme maturation permease subunit